MDQPFMLQPLQFTQMPIEKPLRGLPLHQCGVDIRFVLRRPTSHIQPEPVRLPPAALRFPAIRHIAISVCAIATKRSLINQSNTTTSRVIVRGFPQRDTVKIKNHFSSP